MWPFLLWHKLSIVNFACKAIFLVEKCEEGFWLIIVSLIWHPMSTFIGKYISRFRQAPVTQENPWRIKCSGDMWKCFEFSFQFEFKIFVFGLMNKSDFNGRKMYGAVRCHVVDVQRLKSIRYIYISSFVHVYFTLQWISWKSFEPIVYFWDSNA